MGIKRCSKCGKDKCYSQFYKDPNPRNKTGLQSRCKECIKAASLLYWSEHRERKREHDKTYRERYPEKQREFTKRKRAANPDLYKEIDKKKSRKYRERNPGCSLKGNAERLKRWRTKHPERQASWQAARRVAMKRIPVWGEPEKIEVVYQKAKHYGWEVDHIIPLKHPSVCGLHVWHNLQLLDRNLNRTKHNMIEAI